MQENVFLRDMGIAGIAPTDGRRIEIVATGLPMARGIPLVVDATLVSPLHCNGQPWTNADTRAAVAIQRGERKKDDTYPELVDSGEACLWPLACETGGRWSDRRCQTVRQLAAAKARSAPRHLRASLQRALRARWWSILSCAQQDALASSLLGDGLPLLDGHDGTEPNIVDVLLDAGRS